jgi:hypothetical protein
LSTTFFLSSEVISGLKKGGFNRRGEKFLCSPLCFSLHLLKDKLKTKRGLDKILKEGYNILFKEGYKALFLSSLKTKPPPQMLVILIKNN